MTDRPINTAPTTMAEAWKETQANMAIEGIYFPDEEKAVFQHIIDTGMSAKESLQYVKDYFHGNNKPMEQVISKALGNR